MDNRTIQAATMLKPQTAALLKAAAEKEGRTVSTWIERLIERELDKQLKKHKAIG